MTVLVEEAFTGVVAMLNVALDDPAGTVTVFGTVAGPAVIPRLTTVPPAGAGPLRVTVPTQLLPPTTVVGLSESPVRLSPLIVKVVLADPPFATAVMVAEV